MRIWDKAHIKARCDTFKIEKLIMETLSVCLRDFVSYHEKKLTHTESVIFSETIF